MDTTNNNLISLKQNHLLFGTRTFSIENNATLLVSEQSLSRRHETLIPLSVLQANPTYSSSFSIKWLLHGVFVGLLSAGLFYWGYQHKLVVLYVLALILTGTSLVLFYRFFLYTTRLVIFRHAQTNENLLYLWRNRPNNAAVDRFVTTLSQAIRQQEASRTKH